MDTKGIRILDEVDGAISVKLPDILEEIQNGNSLYWAILDLDAMGNLGEGKSIPVFEAQIRDSEKGFFINWEELVSLSYKFTQIIDISIIGCYNKSLLHFYETNQEKYETCDIVIELINSSFWQIFSKNYQLINNLSRKFKDIEFLESDFQKDFYK